MTGATLLCKWNRCCTLDLAADMTTGCGAKVSQACTWNRRTIQQSDAGQRSEAVGHDNCIVGLYIEKSDSCKLQWLDGLLATRIGAAVHKAEDDSQQPVIERALRCWECEALPGGVQPLLIWCVASVYGGIGKGGAGR